MDIEFNGKKFIVDKELMVLVVKYDDNRLAQWCDLNENILELIEFLWDGMK